MVYGFQIPGINVAIKNKKYKTYHLCFDEVAKAMQPALALRTLDDEVAFAVGLVAAGAGHQRGAGPAFGAAVHPGAVESRVCRAAGAAARAPLEPRN